MRISKLLSCVPILCGLCVVLAPFTLVAEDPCVEAKRLVQKGVALGDSSEEELNFYRQAMGLCKSLSEAHYNFGLVKLRQGFADEATEAFDQALELRPKETKYVLGKALAKLEGDDTEAAKTLYEQARSWEPENIQAIQGLSLVEKRLGNLEGAVKLLEESLLYRSTDTVSRFNLGVIYEEQKESAKARREYRNVLSVDPNHLQARERLALLLVQDRKHSEAWELVAQVDEHTPGARSSLLLNLKGFVAKELGDLDKAELAYRDALQLDAADVSARLELSNILIKKQQPALALEVLHEEALEKVKEKPLASKLYNSKGWAELELGKLAAAQQSLETAVSLDRNNAHAFNNLGVLYQRTKQAKLAEQNFVKAIELKGDFAEARSNLKTLQSMLEDSIE